MTMTKSSSAAITLMVLGFVVLAVAGLLPRLLPIDVFWSEEQAREQAIAASRLHQTTHQAAHVQESSTASSADKVQAQQEFEAAQARYEASRAALDRAQFWRRTVPRLLWWTGGGISLLGVLIYVSASSARD